MQPNKRSRKRTRQAKEAEQARHHFQYASLASATLKKISLDVVGVTIVDVEIVPQFSGAPDGMCGWLIFASRNEAKRARAPSTATKIESKARSALVEAGFPPSSVGSFEVRYTSLPEIEAGGGRFYFFRG
jgi:hypothetical protein